MSNQPMLAVLAALALAACGSDSGDSTGSPSEDEAAVEQDAGPSAAPSGDAIVIGPRTYTSGSAKVKVTGFFEVDGTQQLGQSGLTDDDQTWIPYGTSGGEELNVLFTNSTAMAEHGVTIGVGPYTVTATSTSGECRTHIDVQAAQVSGHYSCTGSTGYNNQTGEMGKVNIEVEFSAGS